MLSCRVDILPTLHLLLIKNLIRFYGILGDFKVLHIRAKLAEMFFVYRRFERRHVFVSRDAMKFNKVWIFKLANDPSRKITASFLFF